MTSPVQVSLTRLAGAPGQPVLVVGPSLGTRVQRLWQDAATHLDGFDVLGWDLPGHGLSPAAHAPFTLAELATAVLAEVDRVTAAGGPTSYLYAGDSVGGAVGLQLSIAHPERLSGLVLVCSAARFGIATAWEQRAALVRAEGMAALRAGTPARWFGSKVRAVPTPAAAGALADLDTIDAESYALACEAIAAWDATERLAAITTPVLAVAGADDTVAPATTHQRIARTVAHGRFAVLRGVGHLAPLEDPLRTAALVREHARTAQRTGVRPRQSPRPPATRHGRAERSVPTR